jgi:hypothetical protein
VVTVSGHWTYESPPLLLTSSLGVDEFAVAMHLCVGLTKRQLPMPPALPAELGIPQLMPKPEPPAFADALSSALSDTLGLDLSFGKKNAPVALASTPAPAPPPQVEASPQPLHQQQQQHLQQQHSMANPMPSQPQSQMALPQAQTQQPPQQLQQQQQPQATAVAPGIWSMTPQDMSFYTPLFRQHCRLVS